MTTSQAQGHAQIFSNVPDFLGPKPLDGVRFVGQFGTAGATRDWTVAAASFEPIVLPDVQTDHGKLNLSIGLDQEARGKLDTASWLLTINAVFLFEAKAPTTSLPASRLVIKLDTDSHTLRTNAVVAGQLMDGQGQVALAGIGTFNGGLLGGFRCALKLDAKFTPAP